MPRIVRRSLPCFALAVLSLATAATLRAGEGMWMPQQVPLLADELKAKGFALDPAQVTDLLGDPMGAIVSLGGCTASFVSPQGLIATNHHCVYGSVQFNSTAERDLITTGFLAKNLAEELPTAPGSYVYVTSAIRDVTAEVLAAVQPPPPRKGRKYAPLTDLEVERRGKRRQRELVDACEQPGGVRCVLGSFFEGTQYLLITQLEIQDVRLVYAPASGIGNYGGEVDNWMWPRHTGDFAFLRAYVSPEGKAAAPAPGNVPFRPKHWLKVATEGVRENDLVWIAGYPGRTFRYQTAAEVVEARDFGMPRSIEVSLAMNGLLEKENQRGKEVELSNYARIRGNANRLKKFEGILTTMKATPGKPDPVEAQRRSREEALAARAAAGGQAEGAAAKALAEIDALVSAKAAQRERDQVLDWFERSSPMLSQAYKLYRLSIEKTKEDLDRAEGYRDRDLSRFDQALARTQRSIEPVSDRAGLRYWLQWGASLPAGQRIGALDAALAATGAGDPAAQIEALLDAFYAGTKVGELAERQAMSRETTAQLDARGDAMVNFARAWLPEVLAREEAEGSFDGAMLRLRPPYLEGLKALQGGRLYPDANGTLRVTFGEVVGSRPRDGLANLPQTTLDGVVAKATGVRPFDAPAALLAAAARPIPEAYRSPELGTVPVNFLATCDTTGGNSGSAVLNGKGELVGLAFDGVWEGVVSDYLFLDDRVRGIVVDALYMRYVMDEVDGAHHLLREMSLPVYAAAP